MVKLAEETLNAIGRMTVAATELEHTLARIGAADSAARSGADSAADGLFVQPGAPLRAAREAARSAPQAYRDEWTNMVEGAATQLGDVGWLGRHDNLRRARQRGELGGSAGRLR